MRSWFRRLGLVSLLGASFSLNTCSLNREVVTAESSNTNWFTEEGINVFSSQRHLDKSVKPEDMESTDFDYKAVVFLDKVKQADIERVLEIGKMEYWEVIEKINNPNDAAIYCSRVLKYGKTEDGVEYDKKIWGGDFWQSFKITHENPSKEGDCDDIAVAAAVFLGDNGFPPYVLFYLVEAEKKGIWFLFTKIKMTGLEL